MKPRPRLTTGPLGGAGVVALWGASSYVNQVQRGTITMTAGQVTNTATILAVDMQNTVVRFLGSTFNGAGINEDESFARLSLTNATTITITRGNGVNIVIVSFEVTEYAPGVIKSIQRGTVNSAGTTAINAVNTAKTELVSLGQSWTTAGDNRGFSYLVLTSAVLVSCLQNGGDGSVSVMGFQAVEWF